jgi:DNA polymerase V
MELLSAFTPFKKKLELLLPLYTSQVPAGFPSPAENDIENGIDLNETLVKHPTATFFVRVKGDSMRDAGITSGDTLIVDRALAPANTNIVVAILNGEFTVKRFIKASTGRIFLRAENVQYKDIEVMPERDEFEIWGVVTYVIHKT